MTTPTVQDAQAAPLEIGRSGSFLWQLDDGTLHNGQRVNVWSGGLYPNNGYSPEHAIKAAMLFQGAPALMKALRKARIQLPLAAASWNEEPQYRCHVDEVLALIAEIDAALARATGEQL